MLSRLGEDEVVTAFEVQSGKQVWQQRYRSYQVNPRLKVTGRAEVDAGDRRRPHLHAGDQRHALGLRRRDWQTALAQAITGQFDASSPDFGAAMSPLVDDGL